jgi:hypothetical protein
MQVRIDSNGRPTSSPTVLFHDAGAGFNSSVLDVSPNGDAFLVRRTRSTSQPLTLMIGWWALLDKKQ